jgi:hypothetical protein
MVTWREAWRYKQHGDLAGFGPISNGVPEAVGGGVASEREMPPPPPGVALRELDDTLPNRRSA